MNLSDGVMLVLALGRMLKLAKFIFCRGRRPRRSRAWAGGRPPGFKMLLENFLAL